MSAAIIDIDSHFEPGQDWLEVYPSLKKRLPALSPGLLAVDAIVGDMLRGVPRDEWPPMKDLVPPGSATLFGSEKEGEKARRAEFEGKSQFQVANAAARMKWLDEQGIAQQHVICLAGVGYALVIDELALRQEVIAAANEWLATTCAASGGRLRPVTALDYHDLAWAVGELTRMRAQGSRIFLVPAYPVNGVAPIHPSWDRLWAAACDLGMMPMLHTGFERMHFDPGWANQGGDLTVMRMICSAHRHVAPTTLVNSMIYSGLFERFPKLTLMLAEVGTGWLPFLHREIDDRVTPVAELFLGKAKLAAKPSETLARHVKATPLSAGNDSPLLEIMGSLPDEMLVFSSDFPHFEGFTRPVEHYRQVFGDLSMPQVERFMGGTIESVFRQMGDPLL